MTNADVNGERNEARPDLSKGPSSGFFEAGIAARAPEVSQAEKAAFEDAMIGLGLDPRTAPDLSALRAPRVEIEAAPRQSAAERSFEPLSTPEWHLVRAELELVLTRHGTDWKARRQRWDGLLFMTATGLPWTRLPRRFGSPESGRKHLEAGARSGVIERVAGELAHHAELAEQRRALFRAVAARALEKRERLEDSRGTAARQAVPKNQSVPT